MSTSTGHSSKLHKWRDKAKGKIKKLKDGDTIALGPPRVTTDPYNYEELRRTVQIRVLHLRLGSSDEEPLVGDLESRMLDDTRPYITLSYVWGRKEHCHRLKTSEGKSIFITESLCCALLDARNWARRQEKYRDEKTIPIWADAVCINQDHVEERNVQVSLMSVIYSRAELLITYLGTSIPPTEVAINLAARLHTWLDENAASVEDDISLKMLEKAGLPSKKDVAWTGLIDLFDRSWYSRVWLLQESVLSQEHERVMLCGRHALPRWPSLVQLWTVIFSHGGPDLVVFLRLRKKDRMSSVAQMICMRFLANPSSEVAVTADMSSPAEIEQLTRRDWSNMLFISHFLQSHDPRDKVYGLLGLVQDSWVPDADYDLSPEEVYEDMCAGMLEHNRNLDFLYCVYPAKSDYMNLPSWVPDWSHVPHDCPIPIRGFGCWASGSTTLDYAHDPENHTLTLRGVVIDTVSDVITELDINRSLKHHCALRASKRESLSSEGPIYSREDVELFWDNTSHLRRQIVLAFDADIAATGLRTFKGNRQSTTTKQEWRAAGKEDRQRPDDAETLDEEDAATLRNNIDDRQYASLNFFFGSFSGNRPLLRTSKGSFGLGPRNIEVGDTVVIFHGARTPFIVRRTEEDVRWQFKGFCFVDGYMHGEAMEDDLKEVSFMLT